ncbi:uncharacterized protein DS421_20g698360 [Arachis hypogaea]|nr:uncharacterized protein DS421_20g698360 [Arachis hypogaea]
MVTGKPFCHRSCPETPSESDSAAAGVLRPPEPPPEVLATSAVAEKVAVDPPEFLAAAEVVAAAGSKSQLLRVIPVRNYVSKSLAVALVIAKVAGSSGFGCRQFGLRRKGLDEAFGLWICVLR